jgi:hypothetical protein
MRPSSGDHSEVVSMADQVKEDMQRRMAKRRAALERTAKRRAAVVLSLLKGETSVAEAARKHGFKVAEVEEWQERFLLAGKEALSRPLPNEEWEQVVRDQEELRREVGYEVEDPLDTKVLLGALRLRRRRGDRLALAHCVIFCRDRRAYIPRWAVAALARAFESYLCESAWKIDPLNGGIGVQN